MHRHRPSSRLRLAGVLGALFCCAAGQAGAGVPSSAAEPAPPPAAGTPSQAAREHSFWQKLRPFRDTTLIITAGVSVGPYIAGASSHVGLVLRPRRSPERQGIFFQNGVEAAVAGAKRISSPLPELRGWEWNFGPRSCRHPVYGDRVGITIIPDTLSIAAARSGGLGLAFSLPIPGLPHALCRMPFSFYVSNPKLCKVAGKIIDCVDRLTATATRLAQPVLRPARRVLKRVGEPVLRAARPAVARVKGWVDRHRRRPPAPLASAL